jgi:uncharacterized membrane protein YfcA
MELAFFAISGVYAAAGFAGGSSFLAALSAAGIPASAAAVTALLCNVASALSVLLYREKCAELFGDFFWVLLPGAFAAAAGAKLSLHLPLFTVLLCLSLLAASWSLLVRPIQVQTETPIPKHIQAVLGAAAGAAGGATGIGGGVFLAVLIHMFFRSSISARRLTLLTGLFILINSLTGLFVRTYSGQLLVPGMELLIGSAFVGGAIGRIVSQNLREIAVRRVTAGAIAVPGIWMLWSML